MRRRIGYHGELGRRQMLRFCLATTLRCCDPIPDLCRNDATVRSAAAVDLFGAAGTGAHARTPSSPDAPRGPLLQTPIPCDGSRASRRTDVNATDGHWRISLCSKRRHLEPALLRSDVRTLGLPWRFLNFCREMSSSETRNRTCRAHVLMFLYFATCQHTTNSFESAGPGKAMHRENPGRAPRKHWHARC